MAQLEPALREKGVESLTVVNTPIERARLYFRYHPLPNLLAASDPERVSHRAFGLPNLEFTENESDWPHKVAMDAVMTMRIDMPDELPEPMDPMAAAELLNKKDGYEMTEADQQMMATGHGQLVGQFLLDRRGHRALELYRGSGGWPPHVRGADTARADVGRLADGKLGIVAWLALQMLRSTCRNPRLPLRGRCRRCGYRWPRELRISLRRSHSCS